MMSHMLQDPTEQVDIDNFMVQQLDGTSNEWGWCKQKVLWNDYF
jgi:enolase